MSLLSILLILLIIGLIVGLLPRWPHSQGFGWGPSSIGGVVLIIFLLWLFLGGGLARLRF